MIIRKREFSNGWEVKLFQEGADKYVVRIFLEGEETTNRIKQDLPGADHFFGNVCRILQQAADRKKNEGLVKFIK